MKILLLLALATGFSTAVELKKFEFTLEGNNKLSFLFPVESESFDYEGNKGVSCGEGSIRGQVMMFKDTSQAFVNLFTGSDCITSSSIEIKDVQTYFLNYVDKTYYNPYKKQVDSDLLVGRGSGFDFIGIKRETETESFIDVHFFSGGRYTWIAFSDTEIDRENFKKIFNSFEFNSIPLLEVGVNSDEKEKLINKVSEYYNTKEYNVLSGNFEVSFLFPKKCEVNSCMEGVRRHDVRYKGNSVSVDVHDLSNDNTIKFLKLAVESKDEDKIYNALLGNYAWNKEVIIDTKKTKDVRGLSLEYKTKKDGKEAVYSRGLYKHPYFVKVAIDYSESRVDIMAEVDKIYESVKFLKN